ITGRARRLMSAPAKLDAPAATEAGSIVEPRPSMTAAPSDETDSISEETLGTTRARDNDSSINRRRKWPRLGNRSGMSASAESGSDSDEGLSNLVPGGDTKNSSSRNKGRNVTPLIGSEP